MPVLAAVNQPQIVRSFADAGAQDGILTTVMQYPSRSEPNQSCVYKTLFTLPSMLAELTVIRDALKPLMPALLQALEVLL